ncbi:hypothetical protein LX81_00298 [Palleronia aestuarii]|uniref:Uncharacterized protein n=1 Tax=Palleronia aestuarii TaxID=568105 RepID=A0A2W7NHD5_9RHOB|nr:hypothetical protein [Palleronia aestuarii]PZX19835.1 hypothetical protein LX81_00298 [Palleronia aestuarii]
MRTSQDSGVYGEHLFARCAVFPKFISRETHTFDSEQLFEFSEVKRTDEKGRRKGTGVYALSICTVSLLPSEFEVHRYGQGVAQVQNDAYFELRGTDPDPQSTYLAHYCIDGSSAYHFEAQHHTIKIRWVEEHGASCHFQVELVPHPDTPKEKRRNERTRLTRNLIRCVLSLNRLPEDFYIDREEELQSHILEPDELRASIRIS